MREINILCEMTRLQKELYISCRNRVTDTTNGVTSLGMPIPLFKSSEIINFDEDPTLSNNDQLNYVMMLRRICSHPYTFGSDARATPTPGEHLILNSGFVTLLSLVTRTFLSFSVLSVPPLSSFSPLSLLFLSSSFSSLLSAFSSFLSLLSLSLLSVSRSLSCSPSP